MIRYCTIFLSVVLVLFSHSLRAEIHIQHWLTTNGAKVYFVEAPELPMIDINVVFDAGAARDGTQAGVALLTNAMLDEGAAGKSTDEIAAEFANVGARFSLAAQRDMASASLRSLTDETNLTAAMTTFTQVLTTPDFPVSSFERLKKQVQIGLQAEKQSPAKLASRAFFKNLFGQHPYASMPAGDAQSVELLTLSQLKNFYQQFYVAKNAVIVMVGAVEKNKAAQLAEQIASGLQTGEQAKPLAKVDALAQAKTVRIDYPSSQTHIYIGQSGIKRQDPDYFALYVGNHILGGSGLVSILSDEIREKRGLSYSVYSYFLPMRDLGPYQMGLQTRNENIDIALSVMRSTLENFIENGPTSEQLMAAKQNITGGFALRIDSNRKLLGYLAMLAFYDMPLDYLDTFKQRINAVTIEQIQDAFQRRINPNKMVTVLVGGQAKEQK
jgi:zinc protease